MPIYWTNKSIPELSNLPDDERKRLWRVAHRQAFGHWQTWAAMAGLGLAAGGGGYLGDRVGHGAIGAAIGGGLGGLLYAQVVAEMARPYLRDLINPRAKT